MKPRIALLLLAFLGIIAALCAAVLTASIQARPLRQAVMPASEVKMLVATRALDRMSVVERGAVEVQTVPSNEAPEGYFSEPSQVIGKVLALPALPGQPLTKGIFAREGAGMHMAGYLPVGKRAVSVSLSDYSSLEGLLYPGSVVDILATFDMPASHKVGEAVSTTLFENVQILAVKNVTVASEEKEKAERASVVGKPGKNNVLVTVMVDSNQAEALQLAMEYGVITLAMRNPHDSAPVDEDATLLSGGRLAQYARLLDPMVAEHGQARTAAEPETEVPAEEAKVEEKPALEATKPDPTITVDVIRGVVTESVSFPLNADKS
ncbi:MAG: Flp pilus assembly protein CpaB [Candidatus Hydrogenedentes bacterium]|nr:Flp pilus assembly protein CpaB [Candidatus Hydrogenedentota bacterium]